jgi:hypothetical protein
MANTDLINTLIYFTLHWCINVFLGQIMSYGIARGRTCILLILRGTLDLLKRQK